MEGGNIEQEEHKEEEYKEEEHKEEEHKEEEHKEEEHKEEEDNSNEEDNKEEKHKEENNNEDNSNEENSNENNNNNNVLNGGGKKKTGQDLEKNLSKNNSENKEEDDEEDEQDLKNPAHKSAFEKSRSKTESENNDDDDDDDDDEKDLENSESKVSESTDIEYTIDYLIEDDEKLINSDNVKNQVDTYIDNYNSDSMKKYKLSFNKLYQKYSNKKYKIKIVPVNDNYKSTKIVVVKNDKKEDNSIITELIKPHYIYYNDDAFNLYHFKNKVSNTRAELLYKYEILVSKINITPEEKTNFEKERNKFINLLEEYYSYTLYHKKINKISTLNTTQLIIQSKYNIYSDNNESESVTSILSGDTYVINNTIINSINTNNIDKLTSYNDIILQLTGKNSKEIKKDTKLIEEMKLYLNKNEKEKLIKQIEESKIHQDNYINYIVSRLPIT